MPVAPAAPVSTQTETEVIAERRTKREPHRKPGERTYERYVGYETLTSRRPTCSARRNIIGNKRPCPAARWRLLSLLAIEQRAIMVIGAHPVNASVKGANSAVWSAAA